MCLVIVGQPVGDGELGFDRVVKLVQVLAFPLARKRIPEVT